MGDPGSRDCNTYYWHTSVRRNERCDCCHAIAAPFVKTTHQPSLFSSTTLSRPQANWSKQWRRQLWARGHVSPSTSTFFYRVVQVGVNLTATCHLSKYCVICETSWCRCQHLTAHFDEYCISHKTVSYTHRATAAPSPEVRRECPMT